MYWRHLRIGVLCAMLMWVSVAVAGDPSQLLFPLDGDYSVVPFAEDGATGAGPAVPGDPLHRNDDDSYGFTLPFTFSFYGESLNDIWINNNGNLSFFSYYSTYTPAGFPVGDYPMVAPFWGDVDTRDEASGVAYYRFLDGNNDGSDDTMVVTWDNVGYYSTHADLTNTFQVAISDGTNPQMGIGNNICYSFDDMGWTTGDASGGEGGFGGSPATVGVNRGDGTDFFQIGRFDHPGTDYQGTEGISGVDWLDGQDFCFSVGEFGENLPPFAIDLPPSGELWVDAALGEILDETFTFIGPEVGQQVMFDALGDPDGAITDGLLYTAMGGDPGLVSLYWAPGAGLIGHSYELTFNFHDDYSGPGGPAYASETVTIHIVPEPVAGLLLAICALIVIKRRA